MSVPCDFIVNWEATPEQLASLGSALWRWCTHTEGNTGIYQYLDNQALADLIAGKLPVSSQPPREPDRRGVHFRVRDEVSQDRQATVDGLRRELPTGGDRGCRGRWHQLELRRVGRPHRPDLGEHPRPGASKKD